MTTTKQTLGAVTMAALLLLAGCSSAVPGTNTGVQTTQAPTDAGGSTDGSGGGSASDGGSASSADLTFYVSDRPGSIDDFEHLNVTITKIGLHRTGDAGADDADDSEADDSDDADDGGSATETTADSVNADYVETTTVEQPNETTVGMTETEESDDEETESEDTETESEDEETETEDTETESEDEDESEETETEETESADDDESEADDGESESDDESESESEDGESDAGWVTQDVDDETVDLTKLKGANATAIGNLSVPAGEYDKVFVYVSDINATLTNGESVNVKLPSQKLQLNKGFTLSANSSPDFVFDINVHKAGNSGKYILKPVVGESGTGDQVEIEKVDKNGKPENPGNSGEKGKDKGKNDDSDDSDDSDDPDDSEDGEQTEDDADSDDADDSERAELEADLTHDVRAGENVTLTVTDGDGAVANATVEVNGEVVGETDADGTLSFEVPDAKKLKVTVTKDDAEAELERKVKGGNGNGPNLASPTLV